MKTNIPVGHQTSFFGTDLMLQLDPQDPLLQLSAAIPWHDFDQAFTKHYTQGLGAPQKSIRLMVGLLILKQLENLSDEQVVVQWKRNPYYQAFCGLTEFQQTEPCHSTELVKFRQRIGKAGFERIFQMSIALHGRQASEPVVNIDTTVQEKNIIRKQTVEHPFGTIKCWMGSSHFLMRRFKNVRTEMSLHVLAYNLK